MELQHLTVCGTITQDGLLCVEERLNLPPGPVNVTIEAASAPNALEEFHTMLEEIWADRKARGVVPRTKEEIDAEIDELRNSDEPRLREIEQLQVELYAARNRN